MQKAACKWAALCFSISAVPVPVGFDLSRQRHNAVVLSFIFHDAGQGSFDIRLFDQQAHTAAQLSLNGPGRRGNAVFDAGFQQQIPQGQTLLIIDKQDVPANIGIRH